MRYLLRSVGVLVLVALGLRLAAWLVTPVIPALVGLFLVLAILVGLLFPEFFRRR